MNHRKFVQLLSDSIKTDLSDDKLPKIDISAEITVYYLLAETKDQLVGDTSRVNSETVTDGEPDLTKQEFNEDHQYTMVESEEDLVFNIATNIAEKKDFSTKEFAPPLADVVDLDALTRLIQSSDTIRVKFTYEDVKVKVDADGCVTVTNSDRKSSDVQ